MSAQVCCQCESQIRVENLYGHRFCAGCRTKLGLHSDKTILKNAERWDDTRSMSYEEELVKRLRRMERDFIKSKVKLFHILARLEDLK